MTPLVELFLESNYRGQHQAPDKSGGAPLYDVTLNGIYPDDFYSSNGFRYYGEEGYYSTYSLIFSLKNRPNARVKIYRSVPLILSNDDKILQLQQDKKEYLRRNKIHKRYSDYDFSSGMGFYDWADMMIDDLKKSKTNKTPITKINPGDWVSISRDYVVEHGRMFKENKILSKTVRAKELFTDGNSINEWGWSP